MKRKLKSARTLAATLIIIGSLAGGANAALTMHVDTTLKTLVVSGTGITNTSGNNYWIFSAPSDFGGSGADPKFDITSLINLSGASWTADWGDITYGDSGPSNAVMFGGNLQSVTGSVTMTTTGTTISYAGADLGIISRIEANLETTWSSAFDSSGTNGLFVTANPIPEPSSTLLLGLGGLGLAVSRRRNH